MITCRDEYITPAWLDAIELWDQHSAMCDKIDELRAKVWELERPEREYRELMDRLRAQTAESCARGIHPVTTWDADAQTVCSHCRQRVTIDWLM